MFTKEMIIEALEQLGLEHDNPERLEKYLLNFGYATREQTPTEALLANLDSWVQDEQDNYQGEYESGADFCQWLADEIGDVHNTADWLVIDWEATWERAIRFDYTFQSGYVWRNH